MSQTSPGPWRVDVELRQYAKLIDVVDANGDNVCEFSNADDDVDLANATLIAAAPDLLAALKAVLDAPYEQDGNAGCVRWDGPSDIISAAEAAIAKAEGRS